MADFEHRAGLNILDDTQTHTLAQRILEITGASLPEGVEAPTPGVGQVTGQTSKYFGTVTSAAAQHVVQQGSWLFDGGELEVMSDENVITNTHRIEVISRNREHVSEAVQRERIVEVRFAKGEEAKALVLSQPVFNSEDLRIDPLELDRLQGELESVQLTHATFQKEGFPPADEEQVEVALGLMERHTIELEAVQAMEQYFADDQEQDGSSGGSPSVFRQYGIDEPGSDTGPQDPPIDPPRQDPPEVEE